MNMVNKFKLASVMMKTHKTQIRIKDIGSVLTGRTPSTSNPDNYNAREICFVKPSDLCEGKINTIEDTEFYISQKAREQSVCVPINSVLVTCIGIIGKIGIATKEIAFNQQINAIIPDPDLIFYKYLAYLLLAKRRYLSELANAPVVPILNKTNFSDIQLNIHDLPEQKRIAERLDKVQELIAKQKEQIAKLDLLIKSRFLDMFGDPISNPKKWPTLRMGDIFKITSGGTPSRKKSENFENGTIPWVKTGDLNVPVLTHTDECITEIGLQNSSAKLFPVGTVLVAMYGATIGAVSILGIEACSNQACAAFLPVDTISPIYLYFFLFLQKQHFIKLGVGGAQPNISGEILKREKILCPPIVLQTQFANFVKSVEQQKEVFSTRLSHFETLYNSLMQEYFG